MDPQAIIAALPWLRRAWKFLPPNLRVPVLLIAAAIGVWQYLQGRNDAQDRPGRDETAPSQRSAPSSG